MKDRSNDDDGEAKTVGRSCSCEAHHTLTATPVITLMVNTESREQGTLRNRNTSSGPHRNTRRSIRNSLRVYHQEDVLILSMLSGLRMNDIQL